jgi:drug/metabolite transporter (DMT)-like permease
MNHEHIQEVTTDLNVSVLMIAMAAFFWGLIGIFGTWLKNAGVTPMEIVAVRSLISAFSMVAYLWLKDRSMLKVRFRDLKYFFGTGLLSFLFFNYCFFTAMKLTSVSVSVTLLYTGPVFVVFLSRIFFGEPLTRAKLAALVLTLTGCALVTGLIGEPIEEISAVALLAGISAGFGFALFSIFGKFALRHYHSMTVTTYTFVFASAGVVFLIQPTFYPRLLTDSTVFLPGIALALLCTVMPFLLYTRGIKHLEAGKAALITTLEPAIAALVGFLIFAEPISPGKLAGIGLVVCGVLIVNLSGWRRVPKRVT